MSGKIWKLDHRGHGLLKEWADDKVSIEEGRETFNALVKSGHALARMPDENGNDGEVVKVFDPDVEYVAIPAMQGG